MATRGHENETGRMARWSRILILVASLALGLTYFLPIWTIDLDAPQYPEGLGMVIRINTIEGQKEHDLTNINNLNHYIGMQRIVPESIPELKIMPVVVAVLMVTGLLVAYLGRKRLLYAWTAGFLVVSLVGLADFWKWEYDYGHNLDEETAIIKIPGMSYQPPLIGSREILNFTAHSWPGAGGMIAILAAATAVLLSVREWRSGNELPPDHHAVAGGGPPDRESDTPGTSESTRRSEEAEGAEKADGPEEAEGTQAVGATSGAEAADRATTSRAGHSLGPVATLAAAALVLAGCAEPEPRPLVAGVDGCADCLMIVDAGGHGAEIVTETGKIYTFDSAECMVNHLLTSTEEKNVHSTWVTDFASPEELVRAQEAHYLVSPMLASPMGLGITAFRRAEDRDGAVNSFGGRAAEWEDVVELVSEAWPDGRPPMKHGGHTATILDGHGPAGG